MLGSAIGDIDGATIGDACMLGNEIGGDDGGAACEPFVCTCPNVAVASAKNAIVPGSQALRSRRTIVLIRQ